MISLVDLVRNRGDEIVAAVSATLNTPFDTCRRTPILLLLRMYKQANRIEAARKARTQWQR